MYLHFISLHVLESCRYCRIWHHSASLCGRPLVVFHCYNVRTSIVVSLLTGFVRGTYGKWLDLPCCFERASYSSNQLPVSKYKVVQIWPGRFVCKQVTVFPGHIWTTLYMYIPCVAGYHGLYRVCLLAKNENYQNNPRTTFILRSAS